MEDRLANEILDAANNTGGAVKNVRTLTKWLKQQSICSLPLVRLKLYPECVPLYGLPIMAHA